MQYMTKAAHCLEEICEVIHYCAKVTTSPPDRNNSDFNISSLLKAGDTCSEKMLSLYLSTSSSMALTL